MPQLPKSFHWEKDQKSPWAQARNSSSKPTADLQLWAGACTRRARAEWSGWRDLGFSINGGNPKWMVFLMENGYPYFRNPPFCFTGNQCWLNVGWMLVEGVVLINFKAFFRKIFPVDIFSGPDRSWYVCRPEAASQRHWGHWPGVPASF